jgi:pyruvate formate lyase activating enzyme
MNRRRFIKNAAGAGMVLGRAPGRALADLYAFGSTANLARVEARYYKRLPDREIECELCPRRCRLGDKERGYCGVRENDGGVYRTLIYGKICSLNADPIEKKPFFHVLPGTRALSLAAAGCNVHCKFCQNWEISQVRPEQIDHFDLSPRSAAETAVGRSCPTIAFTYSEPVVDLEYVIDAAREAKRFDIRSLVVTGGHINPEPLEDLTKAVAAIKIDLKSFSPEFYKDYVRGELAPVLEAIRIVAKSGVWLEIVYLVIPSLNDDAAEVRKMAAWIIRNAGPDVPLHFNRFQPMYLLKNLPPTPVGSLEKLRRAALDEGLRFVYVGNVPGHEGESTFCPKCGRVVIRRFGYQIEAIDLAAGRCPSCRTPIPGIWT